MPFDIGVDIGGTNIKLGLVDARGRVVARGRLATRARSGPGQALERIAETIDKLCTRRKARCAIGWHARQIRSIGVGIAGLVDHVHGVVRAPPNLPGWDGLAVKKELERLTGLPVACGNDANAVALGEWLFGAGRGAADMVCLTLGTGVGAGVIVQGRLLLGANHAAGELGHTVVYGDGPECRCGGKGCLERYVGAQYIVQRARQRLRAQLKRGSHRNQISFISGVGEQPSMLFDLAGSLSRLTPEMIGRAARRKDKLASELVREVGFYLGLGLVNVVALLDPERIVIGGGISGLGAGLLKAVRQTVNSRCQVFSGRRLEIVFGRLGSDAGIIGASRLGRHVGQALS